jgi:hypothetical protein
MHSILAKNTLVSVSLGLFFIPLSAILGSVFLQWELSGCRLMRRSSYTPTTEDFTVPKKIENPLLIERYLVEYSH